MLQQSTESRVDQTPEHLWRIIEGMPMWVQVCSLDGVIELVNSAAVKISGYERASMIGQRWPYPWISSPWSNSPFAVPEEGTVLPFQELLHRGSVPEFEVIWIDGRGNAKILGVNLSLVRDSEGNPHQALLIAVDITDRKAKEAELNQAQKIQAVSQLASGVAHDINNNLAVIMGYSEFLLETSESFGDVVRQALSAIQEQSMDCANTVRRIQLFSRTIPHSQFSTLDLNDVVRNAISQNQPTWSHRPKSSGIDIRVLERYGEVPLALGYEKGLGEALAALISNAVDALPDGGTITFATREEGNQVVLEVSDDGVGISDAHLHRIFEPFFTTKGPSSSGLGLSIAYNLVTQQGGKITVRSRYGEGTTFTISVPTDVTQTVDAAIRNTNSWKRSLSVLVVDDEPLVADVFRTFLEAAGHQVVTCLNGINALASFEAQNYDLAVIDLGMPNMDGWELSRRLNALDADFPIIVATGWDVTTDDGEDQGVQVRAVLKKPFGMRELTKAIERVTSEGLAA